MTAKKGIFITMEGPDGAGKSTQIDLLKKYLEDKGYNILLTRDPGGNDISEAIRGIILNKDFTEMGYMTELLLYASARAQLVKENIKPALEAGTAVIADRFVDSSAVYQGIGRGLGIDTVYKVNEFALQGIMPDMTILMDLDAEVGLARKKNQAELDRMERESVDFHKKVVAGYRDLADRYPERILKVDAALQVQEIHDIIVANIEKKLGLE
ncbi:thymidylate kinase [Coprococcus sp. CAG:782]|jgi:dTMP kinase|uniref:dTMP kinase n=1 Tax=Coprococcus sp. OM04-5BH TaxID=2293093 RepID=UPI00033497C9|nr:dTMP kinase [Coprococcus sp. OM04-5BH]RHV34189.1 dTMP kinase [Coprococcus sp. OM04-5BH]CCY54463.1 thymidylate kinase [Coprococcus sp. CAG:782]